MTLLAGFFACAPSGANPQSCGGVEGNAGIVTYGYNVPRDSPLQRGDRALAVGTTGLIEMTGITRTGFSTTSLNQAILQTNAREVTTRCLLSASSIGGMPEPASACTSHELVGTIETLSFTAVASGETVLISRSPTGVELDRIAAIVAEPDELVLFQFAPHRWHRWGDVVIEPNRSISVFARQSNGRIVMTGEDIQVRIAEVTDIELQRHPTSSLLSELLVRSGDPIHFAVRHRGARTILKLKRGTLEAMFTVVSPT